MWKRVLTLGHWPQHCRLYSAGRTWAWRSCSKGLVLAGHLEGLPIWDSWWQGFSQFAWCANQVSPIWLPEMHNMAKEIWKRACLNAGLWSQKLSTPVKAKWGYSLYPLFDLPSICICIVNLVFSFRHHIYQNSEFSHLLHNKYVFNLLSLICCFSSTDGIGIGVQVPSCNWGLLVSSKLLLHFCWVSFFLAFSFIFLLLWIGI